MINKNQKSNLAKLLATENLTVVHSSSAKTASFNVDTRVLTLPIFKDMSEDVYDMFVGHEVGHALWTNIEDIKLAMIDKPSAYHSFINIVEDARIEKFIKRQYPGIKRNFVRGYIQLFEDGFFGVDQDEIPSLNLIDRLNIHFKNLGNFAVNVPFSEEEKVFVQMMEDLETWDDVMEVVNLLWDYSTQQVEEKSSSDENDIQVSSNEDDQDDSTEVGYSESQDDQEENEPSLPTNGEIPSNDSDDEEDIDQEISHGGGGLNEGHGYNPNTHSITDEALQDAFVNEQPNNASYKSERSQFQLIDDFKIHLDRIILNSDDLYNTYKSNSPEFEEEMMRVATEFMRENNSTVSYLAKQFDMKKAATAYKNSVQNRTGILDTTQLHSYKFNDELFLSSTYLPEEKNHAFVAFVDWSGSMAHELKKTVEQLATVALFCRKVGIPFNAYAFTNSKFTTGSEVTSNTQDLVSESFSLLEFFSLKSSNKKFKRELGTVLNLSREVGYGFCNKVKMFGNTYYLHLSGTPLNITAFVAPKIIKMVRQKTGAEKISTMFLTDGYDSNGVKIRNSYNYKTGYLINPITRTPVDTDSTFELYDYLKATTGSKVIVMHITNQRSIPIEYGKRFNHKLAKFETNEKLQDYSFREKLDKKFKKEGFQIFTDNGFDSAYIIRSKNLKIDNLSHLDNLDENATNRKILSAFKKGRSSKLSTRPMLNHFIETMA